MAYDIAPAEPKLAEELVSIRLAAMRDSLQAIGRYDPARARERFLSNFQPENTNCIYDGEQLIGFYVLISKCDHWLLDHLYIHPEYQGKGAGSQILRKVKETAKSSGLPVRLGALKDSESNNFYKKHGFALTHQEEWDNYYAFSPQSI